MSSVLGLNEGKTMVRVYLPKTGLTRQVCFFWGGVGKGSFFSFVFFLLLLCCVVLFNFLFLIYLFSISLSDENG